MTANIQQEISRIVESRNRATQLDNLIQSYRLCARTEGKSEKTIRITTTALSTLRYFLETDHPIIKSFEPGEDWSYCFIEEISV